MRIDSALRSVNIEPLDAEVLMSALIGTTRAELLTRGERMLSEKESGVWREWTERRERGEPVAMILGRKEFYGRDFVVSRHTLIPRPATEGLIDAALAFVDTGTPAEREIDDGIVALCVAVNEGNAARHIVDVGTGSGCIAVTLALLLPHMSIIATDISMPALRVAQENARRWNVSDRVTCVHGNVLAPISELREPFIIVANPPYIPEGTALARDLSYEPHDALFSGEDGMAMTSRLVREARSHPYCRGMALECRADQASKVKRET